MSRSWSALLLACAVSLASSPSSGPPAPEARAWAGQETRRLPFQPGSWPRWPGVRSCAGRLCAVVPAGLTSPVSGRTGRGFGSFPLDRPPPGGPSDVRPLRGAAAGRPRYHLSHAAYLAALSPEISFLISSRPCRCFSGEVRACLCVPGAGAVSAFRGDSLSHWVPLTLSGWVWTSACGGSAPRPRAGTDGRPGPGRRPGCAAAGLAAPPLAAPLPRAAPVAPGGPSPPSLRAGAWRLSRERGRSLFALPSGTWFSSLTARFLRLPALSLGSRKALTRRAWRKEGRKSCFGKEPAVRRNPQAGGSHLPGLSPSAVALDARDSPPSRPARSVATAEHDPDGGSRG